MYTQSQKINDWEIYTCSSLHELVLEIKINPLKRKIDIGKWTVHKIGNAGSPSTYEKMLSLTQKNPQNFKTMLSYHFFTYQMAKTQKFDALWGHGEEALQ